MHRGNAVWRWPVSALWADDGRTMPHDIRSPRQHSNCSEELTVRILRLFITSLRRLMSGSPAWGKKSKHGRLGEYSGDSTSERHACRQSWDQKCPASRPPKPHSVLWEDDKVKNVQRVNDLCFNLSARGALGGVSSQWQFAQVRPGSAVLGPVLSWKLGI